MAIPPFPVLLLFWPRARESMPLASAPVPKEAAPLAVALASAPMLTDALPVAVLVSVMVPIWTERSAVDLALPPMAMELAYAPELWPMATALSFWALASWPRATLLVPLATEPVPTAVAPVLEALAPLPRQVPLVWATAFTPTAVDLVP